MSGGEFGLDQSATECILFNQMQLYNLDVVKMRIFNISINILINIVIKCLALHAF